MDRPYINLASPVKLTNICADDNDDDDDDEDDDNQTNIICSNTINALLTIRE